MYSLRKYHKENRENLKTVVGFNRIRGIGKDESNNIYVVDSCNNQVVKLDNNLTPLRKTLTVGSLFQQPYGILITDEYIFLCGNKTSKIFIFHLNLDLYCETSANEILQDPMDITLFDGIYFVTTHAAIVAITFHFTTSSFTAKQIRGVIVNGKMENFRVDRRLRGICRDNEHLYVAEVGGRLLCLRYDKTNKQLHYVDSIDCSPVAVAHHSGTIYFCRKQKESFYIAKVTWCDKMDFEGIFKL